MTQRSVVLVSPSVTRAPESTLLCTEPAFALHTARAVQGYGAHLPGLQLAVEEQRQQRTRLAAVHRLPSHGRATTAALTRSALTGNPAACPGASSARSAGGS